MPDPGHQYANDRHVVLKTLHIGQVLILHVSSQGSWIQCPWQFRYIDGLGLYASDVQVLHRELPVHCGQRCMIMQELGDDLPDCWYSLEKALTPEVLYIIQRKSEVGAILSRMTDPLRSGCHNQLYSVQQDILSTGQYDPLWARQQALSMAVLLLPNSDSSELF